MRLKDAHCNLVSMLLWQYTFIIQMFYILGVD